MCILFLSGLVSFCGANAATLDVVADRLASLDRLRVDYTHEVFIADRQRSPLDRSGWRQPVDGPESRNQFAHRLTIIRPNALDEFLTDDPDRGYAPLRQCIWDGDYVSQHTNPAKVPRVLGDEEITVFEVVEDDLNAGTFRWCPALQVFDLHMQDSTVPGLNVLALLKSYDARCVRNVGGISTFVASVPMIPDQWTVQYEFDLDDAGTPLRVRAVCDFRDAPTAWREQYVLATADVNGTQLPTDIVVVTYNPAVADYYGIDHIVVTGWEMLDADVAADAVRIAPCRQGSVVHTYPAETAEKVSRYYDQQGTLVHEVRSVAGCSGADVVPREAIRWRMAIPAVALAGGVLVVAVLALRVAPAR